MTNEKKFLAAHVLLFALCFIFIVASWPHIIQEWYYWFRYGTLYFITVSFARPVLYYSAGVLSIYFVARKAFRNDLKLPYKGMAVGAVILLFVYLLATAVFLLLAQEAKADVLRYIYYYVMIWMMDYYWTLCIPGVLLGLAAEKHWNNANN